VNETRSESVRHVTLDVRFSNRPVEVKRFQAIHDCGVGITRGLVLLFGLGTSAGPSWDPRTRWNNLWGDLARWQVQADMRTHLIRRPARDVIPPPGGARSILLSDLILNGRHTAVAPLVHLNSLPSVQMRCIMTAKRRASATIAFFIPRCLAIFIAQALSHDHFAERNSMTWAAS
jgi:hypothetical protein